jgi:hypothetical protein
MTSVHKPWKGFDTFFILLLVSSSPIFWAVAAEAAANRPVVLGVRVMVASHHPLASLAGIEMLKKGGTAIDAAIAANAVLAVVYPTMTSIGGDLFMLIYSAKDQQVYALNASGRSPYAMTREYFKQKGLDRIPVQALGHQACRLGYDVLFTKAVKLFRFLLPGRADHSWEKRMKKYPAPDLWIIDDFGLSALNPWQTEDFDEIVTERYLKSSFVITSNRPPQDWIPLFPDPVMANSA